jgi:hypothetical protein
MSPQHWGGGGRGSGRGGRGDKNDHGAADNNVADVATGGGQRPALHVEGGADQTVHVPHQIRGVEAAVGDEQLGIQGCA